MSMSLEHVIKKQVKKIFVFLSLFFLLAFILFQIISTYVYLNNLEQVVNQWILSNEHKMGEALFVDNLFSLKGRVETFEKADIENSDKKISVMDISGKAISGDAIDLEEYFKKNAYGFSVNIFRSNLEYFNKIIFAGEKQGYILIRVKKDISGLIFQSLAFLIFCFILFFVFRILVLLLVKKIKAVALNPILALGQSMLESSENGEPNQFSLENFEMTGEVKSLIEEYNKLVLQLKKMAIQLKEEAALAAIGELAKQVAHDIRSPLGALNVVSQNLTDIEEDTKNIIRKATARINDIANDLLTMKKTIPVNNFHFEKENTPHVALLSTLLDSIVTEKRMQYRGRTDIEISFRPSQEERSYSYGLFSLVQPKEFNRVISNLVNNSVEALNGGLGKIDVVLKQDQDKVIVEVKDNGRGIHGEILPKLMQRNVSHGKESNEESGFGLGLYHAKKTIESWGGAIKLTSSVQDESGISPSGTTITIELIKASSPPWFIQQLKLQPKMKIVVLDDDPSVHQSWKNRFEFMRLKKFQIEEHYFSTCNTMIAWYEKGLENESLMENILFLIDYEFYEKEINGLEVIQLLNISQKSILVTGRYEEDEVQLLSSRINVGLIPKYLAGFVPIVIT